MPLLALADSSTPNIPAAAVASHVDQAAAGHRDDRAFASFAKAEDTRFPATLAAVPGRAREVWIAPDRTDDLPGKGTYEDPFDGSTAARFDALLVDLPASIQINLLPGLFKTHGSHAWHWKEGWILRGAGIDLTTVQMEPGPAKPSVPQYCFGVTQPGTRHNEMRDLTVDGNIGNQPDGYVVICGMVASSGGFWNVHLKNWGGTPSRLALEQFGLMWGADADADHQSNFTISGCVVDPATAAAGVGGASMLGCIVISSVPQNKGIQVSGVIENNVVTGNFQGDCGIALAGPFRSLRISNNRVRHVVRGFHQDTVNDFEGGTGSYGVDVNHNFFDAVQCAFAIGSTEPITGYRFTDNFVTLVGTTSPANGATPPAGTYLQGNVRKTLVAHNQFSKSLDDITGQSFFNLSAFAQQNARGPNTNNTYLDNLVDPAIQFNYPLTALDSTVRRGNRFTNGQPVPVYTDTPQDLPAGTLFNGLPIQTATGDGSGLTNLKVDSLNDEGNDAPAVTAGNREVVLQPGYGFYNECYSAGLDERGLFGDGSRLTGTFHLVPKPAAADSPGAPGDVYVDGANHRAVFYAPDGSGTNWFQTSLTPYKP